MDRWLEKKDTWLKKENNIKIEKDAVASYNVME